MVALSMKNSFPTSESLDSQVEVVQQCEMRRGWCIGVRRVQSVENGEGSPKGLREHAFRP